MTDDSVITDEMRKAIGTEGPQCVVEIEKRLIKRFAEAVGDSNPLWLDEEYARKSKNGGITAPPMVFLAVMMSGGATRPEVPDPFERVLDIGGEWEFLQSVRPGDEVTSVTTLTGMRERNGKLGKMIFWTFETTHTNQKGEIVATSKSTIATY